MKTNLKLKRKSKIDNQMTAIVARSLLIFDLFLLSVMNIRFKVSVAYTNISFFM